MDSSKSKLFIGTANKKMSRTAARKSQPIRAKSPATVVEHNLTDEEVAEIREAFDLFDTDGSGTINPIEVNAAIASLGSDRSSTIFRLLAGIENLGAEIDFESFLGHIVERLGNRNSRDGIQRILDLFDDDGSGTITIKKLARVARELGENMTVEELTEALRRCSSDSSEELTFDDFYKVMTRKIYK